MITSAAELPNRTVVQNTLLTPYLYGISIDNSTEKLTWHVKIENVFHDLEVLKVHRKSVKLICAHANCPAKHKLSVNPKFVKLIPGGSKPCKSGKPRNLYLLKTEDSEIRNIQNWTVISYTTKPHQAGEQVLEKVFT